MKSFLTGIALAALLVNSSALAAPYDLQMLLFTATSDAFADQLEFNVSIDVNSDATGLIYREDAKESQITLAQLSKGVVLYQSSGKNVVSLSSEDFDAIKGGTITLNYLVNGISGSYRNFDFSLGREGNQWIPTVVNARGIPQAFTSMYLKANRALGRIVGIASITVK
jgi:hypothetical protein